MTSDGDALLAAILAHPDEDTPRLVFADWLEENGQGERAEFIRVQCGRARDAADDALFRRESHLADDAHRWMPPLANFEFGIWSGIQGEIRFGAEGGTVCTFRRGFIDEAQMWAADFVAHAGAVFRAHPVTRVVVTDVVQRGGTERDWFVLWRPFHDAGAPLELRTLITRTPLFSATEKNVRHVVSDACVAWARREAARERAGAAT